MKLSLKHPLVIVAGLLSLYYLLFVCTMSFNNNLGKLALLGAVVGSSFYYGRIGAIVSATVALMLLHKSIEGNDEDAIVPSEDGESAKSVTEIKSTKQITVTDVSNATDDVSNATDDVTAQTTEDAAASEEQDAVAQTTSDMLDNDEKLCRCKDNSTDVSSEEIAPKPDISEGFSLIGNMFNNAPMALSSSSQEFATFN